MRTKHRIFIAVPRRPHFALPLLCLFFTIGIAAVPSWIAASFLGAQMLEHRESFVGELRADQSPIAVNLASGVSLGEIVVEQGQAVEAGQTVATIDQQAVRAAKVHTENQIAMKILERRCLLEPDFFLNMDQPSIEGEGELGQLLGVALKSCEVLSEEGRLSVEEQRVERTNLLQRRQDLLERQRDLLGSRGRTESELSAAFVASLLKSEIDLNQIDLDVNDHQTRILEIGEQREIARLNRLNQLNEDIRENQKLLQRLEDALDAPRLSAPSDGVIQRVRPLQPGATLTQETDIIEITNQSNSMYQVVFKIPLSRSEAFWPGQVLVVSSLGLGKTYSVLLEGIVLSIEASQDVTDVEQVVVKVGLTEESQTRIQDRSSNLALIGPETALLVDVSLPDEPTIDAIASTTERNCLILLTRSCNL